MWRAFCYAVAARGDTALPYHKVWHMPNTAIDTNAVLPTRLASTGTQRFCAYSHTFCHKFTFALFFSYGVSKRFYISQPFALPYYGNEAYGNEAYAVNALAQYFLP